MPLARAILASVLLAAPPALVSAQSAAPQPIDPVASKRCAHTPDAFGCANAANLAVMASPADLEAGRAPSPSLGALEAAAIARLLADEAKDLRRQGTESAGGPQ